MIAQVAAAVVVLSGASLIARTLLELQRAELGFEKDRVLIVELAWDFTRLGTSAGSRSFFDALLPRLHAIRGIEAASPILLAPFPAVGWGLVYRATDRPIQEQRNNPALKGLTIPRTGRTGYVGQLVTKTLLIAGEAGFGPTPSGARGAMLRAYDKATGKEVGAVYMPAPQTGSPMTYMLNGRQYIVVAVSGAGYSGELIAFRLPQS